MSTRFRDKLHDRASKGTRLTDKEISTLTTESAELGGAPAGAIYCDPQQSNWALKADEILHKPANTISMDDAREMQSMETRAFDNLPATGSVASNVQSVAEHNQSLKEGYIYNNQKWEDLASSRKSSCSCQWNECRCVTHKR